MSKLLISTNPAKNYQSTGSVKISSPLEVRQKVKFANEARLAWKELGVSGRTKLLKPLYREFEKRKEEIALLVTREIGKPIKDSLGDLDWDSGYFKWFLENGEKFLAEEITFEDKSSIHKVVYEPIGAAAVIVPWNYPFANFLWGVIPNLIAGNTVVFKHSEECPLSGKLYEKMVDKLGLPKGVFSEVYGGSEVGEILAKEKINLIWFTGSSAVGKRLFELAGKKFVKAILEMGGSNPEIIFSDIDIDEIAPKIYVSRYSNCGQVCDSLKRLIVHDSVFDEVVEKLKKVVESKIVGDPENEKTDLGSLVAKRQLDLLESQVADAIKKGAKIIIGGQRPDDLKGAYYLPTILTGVKRNMRVWREEVFGPVLPVISFKNEKEAVELANDTNYGLGAHIYSKNKQVALRVASKINAGAIDINAASHWFPGNPFGGYKDSGIGREHGRVGFQELCQIKVITSEK